MNRFTRKPNHAPFSDSGRVNAPDDEIERIIEGIAHSFQMGFSRSGNVNAVSPGYTKTRLTGFSGTDSPEEGPAEAVRVALLGSKGPTGKFTHATMGEIPW